MTITYPTTLDTLTNPSSGNPLNSPDHATQHADANDAIEALEAKVGVNGSAVTTSHDYKLSAITGTDKALKSGTSTQSVTNLTLVTPTINLSSNATGDMYYRDGSGVFQRLPIGSAAQILQVSSGGIPEWISNPSAADASTTVKGVVELATLAETLARTTTGGTSAKLVVTPDNLTTVQTYDYASDSVGTDSYAITVTPAPTTYATGQVFRFKAGTANTGAATLNVNSLGAKTIKKNYNSDLADNDIIANQIVEVVYDGTNMQMLSPTAQQDTDAVSAGVQSSSYAQEIPIIFTAATTAKPWTLSNLSEGTGTTQYAGVLQLSSSVSTSFYLTAKLPGYSSNTNYDYASTKILKVKTRMRFPDTSDKKGFGLVDTASPATIYSAQTDVSNGSIRFILNGATMYAHNANGTTATTTDVSSGITFTNWNTYEIVYTPSTDAKFYINGNLVATHTTNLPTTVIPQLTFGVDANGRQIQTTYPIISIQG